MEKNIKKTVKNKLLESHSKEKKLFMIFISMAFLSIFSIGIVSALTFLPTESFTETNDSYGIATITNFLGIGSEIMKVELTDNTDYCLTNCSAEGTAELYMSASLLDDVYFKDLNTGNNKELTYKIYIKEGTVKAEVPIQECSENQVYNEVNKTYDTVKECYSSTAIVDVPNWVLYDGSSLEAGTYKWRIEGTKSATDNVDWVGSFEGVQVTQWASWNSSFNNGLIHVWNFNNFSFPTTAIDAVGINNGTMGASTAYSSSGISGYAADFNNIALVSPIIIDTSTDEKNKLRGYINGSNPVTISAWIKETRRVAEITDIFGIGFDPNMVNWEIHGFYVKGISERYMYNTTTITQDIWHNLVWVYYNTGGDASSFNFYVDGVNMTLSYQFSGTNTQLNSNSPIYIGIGFLNASDYMISGLLDEVYIWNRTLAPNEVVDLYNGGTGIFYNSSLMEDSVYPQFSNYWDNNGTQYGGGVGYFNTTIINTNGTVILTFNNVNYTATNTSGDPAVFNATITLPSSSGTFLYNWSSYGNGTSHNYNISNTQNYTVLPDPIYPVFSDYWDNNATQYYGGVGLFNVTATNTNGSVYLEFQNYSWCYQEFANVSTACGGLNTGIYGGDLSDNFWYDGNWSTYSAYYTYYVNYTKPQNSNGNSSIMFKYDNPLGIQNFSIPSDCWEYSSEKLTFYIQHDTTPSVTTNLYCYNSSNWKMIVHVAGGIVYEEAMIWNIGDTLTYSASNSSGNATTFNVTITGLPQTGIYNYSWFTYGNGTSHNYNLSNLQSYYILPDITLPSIIIEYPANETKTTNTQINVNYTYYDSVGISSCWYSNTSGVVNYTLTDCSNITGVTWDEGWNNIIIWVNDTSNNVNYSGVSFLVDTTPPLIFITSPSSYQNFSYNTSIPLSIGVNDTYSLISSVWYNIDNQTNTTIPPSATQWCYQEFANVSTACGGLGTGNYQDLSTTNSSNGSWYDGNWGTYSVYNGTSFNPTITARVNYTIPNKILSAIWRAKTNGYWGNGSYFPENFTIPQRYLKEQVISIQWSFYTSGFFTASTTFSIYNSTGNSWDILFYTYLPEGSGGYKGIPYEEGIYWGISNYNTTFSTSEGDHIVYAFANDTLGNVNTTFTPFSVDTTLPVVTIASPLNQTYTTGITTNNSVSIDLNYTAIDTHLESCWYFNGTSNVSFANCQTNTTLNYPFGAHRFIVYANDTFGNLGYNDVSANWNYDIFEWNQNYTPITYSGTIETYKINVTIPTSKFTGGILVSLIYNGTNYSASSTNTGDNRVFTSSLTVPTVMNSTNVSFYWQLRLINSTGITTYSSTTINQTINPIFIGSCSGEVNHTLMNLFMADQENLFGIDGTIEYTVNLYPLGSTTAILTTNGSGSYTVGNPVQICSSALSSNYTIGYQLKFYGNLSYFPQYKTIQSMIITPSLIQNITLLDLQVASGYAFQISLRGGTISTQDVLIDVQRQYLASDSFESVESSVTDTSSNTVAHLVQGTVVYNFVVSQYGKIIATFNNYLVKCNNYVTGDCGVILQFSDATTTATDFVDYGNISQAYTYDNSTKTLYLTYSSTDGNAHTVTEEVTQAGEIICTVTQTSTSGTLICDVSATHYGNSSLISYVYVDGMIVGTTPITIGESADSFFGGTRIIIMLILYSTLVMLFIWHPVFIVLGGILAMASIAGLFLISGTTAISVIVTIGWFIVAGGIIAWQIGRRT